MQNIPASSTPIALRQKAIETLGPRLQKTFPGFDWNWNRLVLRDEKDWIDINSLDPAKAVYYEKFVAQMKNGLAFKRPKNAIKMALIVDAEYMEECLEYMATRDVSTYYIIRWFVNANSCTGGSKWDKLTGPAGQGRLFADVKK